MIASHKPHVRGLDMEARPKIRLSCPKGLPPDVVHVSSKLIDPPHAYVRALPRRTPPIGPAYFENSACRLVCPQCGVALAYTPPTPWEQTFIGRVVLPQATVTTSDSAL